MNTKTIRAAAEGRRIAIAPLECIDYNEVIAIND